jgi:hypothetical protein
LDVDEDVPLLEGGCQGDDEVDAAGSRLGKMLISIPSAETMQQDAAMVDKDAFLSKKDEHANLFDAVHQSGVDGKETTVKEDVEIMTEPDLGEQSHKVVRWDWEMFQNIRLLMEKQVDADGVVLFLCVRGRSLLI